MSCFWATSVRPLRSHFSTITQRPFFHRPNSIPPSNGTRSASALAFKSQLTPIRHPRNIPNCVTDAQASLAASQAIQISCLERDFRNAYLILNSLNKPITVQDSSVSLTRKASLAIQNIFRDPNVLPLDRPIPNRLAAHTLLHSHIRAGQWKQSSRLLENMIKAGLRIRPSTLEMHVRLLTQPSRVTARSLQSQRHHQFTPSQPSRTVLQLEPRSVKSESTQLALSLFAAARQYRQRRTERMYKDLIAACILNGEIIVAALLFGVIVRDWQHKAISAAQEEAEERSAAAASDGPRRLPLKIRPAAVYPNPQLMRSVLDLIEHGLSRTGDDPSSKEEFQQSLQALANLATLLDERQLPFPAIAPLIQAMMHCPRVDDRVWVFWKGTHRQVVAYRYFHSVLKRLIEDLPTKKAPIDSPDHSKMPPLSLASYNTLLQYAYRYRHSTHYGSKIFNHMCRTRDPPLKPDIVTYNIMLRSGTLLRQPSLTEFALKKLKARSTTSNGGVHPQPNALGVSELRSLSPDIYTITSFITYLASTNRADDVADVLFDMLPELSMVSHPSWADMSAEKKRELSIQSRAAYMERAVHLGPWFFAALLNTLHKTGRTGLTERVWFLAKAAEKASWDTQRYPQATPWCLPVHAYTSMMNCYAAEGRKGQKIRRLRHLSNPLVSEAEMAWLPLAEEKQYVRGWALFVLRAKAAADAKHTRSEIARIMGSLLERGMQASVRAVYDSLLDLQRTQVPKGLELPHPDARFFNAALGLFARYNMMRPRALRNTRSHWRRHLRLTTKWHARFGIKSQHWTSELERVAESMHEHGFKLPPSVQKLAIGNWSPVTRSITEPFQQEGGGLFHQAQNGSLPWTTRKRRRGRRFQRPHSVPTVKTRGLHCRRRYVVQSSAPRDSPESRFL